MWTMIPSLDVLVQCLAGAFTQPRFQTQCQVLLGWLMCLGTRTEYRVFATVGSARDLGKTQCSAYNVL